MAVGKKSKQAVDPAWRPNYALKDRLPDTKVIRTDFLMNFVGIFLAIVILGANAYREYSISGTRKLELSLDSQITENKTENRKILSLFGEYNRARNTLRDVVAFDSHPMDMAEILILISEHVPESMLIRSIQLGPEITRSGRTTSAEYRLYVRGTLDDAPGVFPSQVIADFQNDLAESELLEGRITDNTLSEFARNNDLKIFNFSIDLRISKE